MPKGFLKTGGRVDKMSQIVGNDYREFLKKMRERHLKKRKVKDKNKPLLYGCRMTSIEILPLENH
jgi:hypothetical protein